MKLKKWPIFALQVLRRKLMTIFLTLTRMAIQKKMMLHLVRRLEMREV
jgi:hypothetical protein